MHRCSGTYNCSLFIVRFLLSVVLLCSLGACATKSYVVLLPDANGAVGKVMVTTEQGSTLLQSANEGTLVGKGGGKTFTVDADRLAKDFGAALRASPTPPRSYLLYFDVGKSDLTVASRATIPSILTEIKQRDGVDISVIGHTDTAGDADTNYVLGLKRAEFVADIFSHAGIPRERIAIESHGKKNPIVQTPDNTDEPRNRAVEVTVR